MLTSNPKNILTICFALMVLSLNAQNTNDTSLIGKGKLWGLAYGDYSFKSHADSLNRGGQNQYSGVQSSQSFFQFRRIYLGYDYEINKTFSSQFLLASEDNKVTNAPGVANTTTGDLLADNKMSLFIKLANVTWHNIYKNADITFGQTYTPSIVDIVEPAWDYRCIERTIADIRRTPHYDFGFKLSGIIINNKSTELGYNFMVGNGAAARPENDQFKWFYGDVYAKLLNKKLILDLYADYNRINWKSNWHHDRYMLKGFAAYSVPKFTVGVETFVNTINKDVIALGLSGNDTIASKSSGISVFARGKLNKNILGFFIRYDNYNPSKNNDNNVYTKYTALTPTYDPNTKEEFFSAGLDYSPISKIHIMPNVWYNKYSNASPANLMNDYDLVFRLSFYYVYGK